MISTPFHINVIEGFSQSFEKLCLKILHEGYLSMYAAKKYRNQWPEENFSAHYADFLEKTDLALDWQVDIKPEIRKYNESHIFEGFSAKTAPRIDLEFTKWTGPREKSIFSVEAKILFENSKTTSKSKISPKTCHQRYIKTGIEHFLNGHYPLPGCMVAYIVEGNKHNIINSINTIVIAKGLSPKAGIIEQVSPPIYPELFHSQITLPSNPTILYHFILDL